ncbi:MAG: hypothetical protein GF408_06305 [Candidatus Omnitrophica bacterium]|nr:hypothetical protein [Candidatus Omnitrophota bacterium]
MSGKIIKCAAVTVLVLSFVFGGVSYAGGHCSKMGWEDKVLKKIKVALMNKKELDLSADQYEKLKKMKYDLKKEVITRDAEKDLVYLDIKKEMWKDKIDLDKVDGLIDKKYDIKKAKAKKVAAACAELKQILSKEQYEEMKDLCREEKKGKKCKR